MKKIKFNKKTKLFLSAITLSATSAVVLAACSCGPGPRPGPFEEWRASEQQLNFVKNNLMANKGFLDLLNSVVKESLAKAKSSIDAVIRLSLFDQSKLTEPKKALGEKNDSKSTAENSSFFANLKALEENYESKKTNTANFPKAEDSTELKAKLSTVAADAETLLNSMDPNVVSEADKTKLTTEGEGLKTILNEYAAAENNDATKEKIEKFRTDKLTFGKIQGDISSKLKSLWDASLKLDRSVNELTAFIETKTPKFLKAAGGSSDDAEVKTALEKLNLNLKTKVLGTLGKDYWSPTTDAPTTVTANESTGLYSINVMLNTSKKASYDINYLVNELTFNKDLLLKEELAINLLAFYINQKVFVDAARLNAYLLNNDSNLEQVLKSLFTSANTIGLGTASYAKFTGAENSDFVKALTAAETAETDSTKKAKITAIKTAFLKNDGVSKALDDFYKTNVLTAAAELQPKVLEVNEAMGTAIEFGNTLKVRGQLNYLQDYVVTPLEKINKAAPVGGKNISTLFDELKTKLEETTDGNLETAVQTYLSGSGYQADVATNLDPYFKKTGDVVSGYYNDLTKGAAAKEGVAKQLSLSELKTELAKFETGDNKPLAKGVKLLKQQLKNSFETQTGNIMKNLYKIYNWGDVLDSFYYYKGDLDQKN